MTAAQKDIIYIDVEDDITAIIGKLKQSTQKIVALVPPKRTGVMQSAVNLRLLARAAEQHEKRLVIITNNKALTGLAAAAKIPVAKNLQSKPELGEIAALDIDNGEEVIDGAQLPIGEHAKQAGSAGKIAAATALGVAATSSAAGASERTSDTSSDTTKAAASGKKTPKVPNFDVFRKKLFFIIAGIVALVVFLVWAILFAPHARVILSTRTIDASVSQQVVLGAGLETSAENATLKAQKQTLDEDVSISFAATGKKNVGDKASGSVLFSTRVPGSKTIVAGTKLTTDNGLSFVVDSEVVVPGATLDFSCGGICPGEAEGSVTAAEGGVEYNGQSSSLNGAPAGVSADFVSPTNGGTNRTVPAVSEQDIDKARKQINDSIDDATARQSLAKQFEGDVVILAESFTTDSGGVESDTAVGAEASNGKAKLVGTVTHTLYAVAREELDDYLETVVQQQIDDPEQQRVYESGVNEAEFTDVESVDQGVSALLTANGSIGPKVDEAQVREIAGGKNYGEIQAELEAINGVDSVDTKLSPFWVSRAPSNPSKISVEFKLNE